MLPGGVLVVGGQREVHLGGPFAEEPHHFQVEPAHQVGQFRRNAAVGGIEQGRQRIGQLGELLSHAQELLDVL